MNHKITIKNLGPIKEIEKFEVKKINLVIGESASGKSILAQAIYFFNFVLEDLFTFDEKEYDFYKKDLLEEFFPFYKNYSLLYYYTDDLYLEVSNEKDSNINFNYSDSLKKEIKKRQKMLDDQFRNIEKHLEKFAKSSKSLDQIERDFYKKLGTLKTMFIPATRSFVSDFDNMRLGHLDRPRYYSRLHRRKPLRNVGDFTLKSFASLYSECSSDFNKINQEYEKLIKGKIKKGKNDDLKFSINNQVLDITNISSGQKELLPIIVILQSLIKKEQKFLLIIEEPEAHLFPKDQKRIFDEIVRTANQLESKIFITTHSPYVLTCANNLIEAEAENYAKLKNKFIKFSDINVQKLVNGKSKSVLDKKTKLINGDYIEEISDTLAEEFDDILNSNDKK